MPTGGAAPISGHWDNSSVEISWIEPFQSVIIGLTSDVPGDTVAKSAIISVSGILRRLTQPSLHPYAFGAKALGIITGGMRSKSHVTVLDNPLILSSLFAMILAQVSKVVLILLTERRWAPGRMTETGGMPSSHSATVSALTTSAALYYGLQSPAFAISLVMGIIVIYDATGVRRAAGRHAEILNELIEEFSHLFEEEKRPRALKTLLGHTYPQVLVGIGMGIGMGFVVQKFLGMP